MTTPVYGDLLARGAVMGEACGWERPLWYAPEGVAPRDEPEFRRPNWWAHVGTEVRGMAAGCGLTEMSTYAKFRITGTDATVFLDHVASARLPDRPDRAGLSLLLTERGGIVGDTVIDNQGSDGFYLVGPTLGVGFYRRWLAKLSAGFDVRIDDVTGQMAAIGVAGPNSRDLLNALSAGAFDDFPFMSSKNVEVGRTACRALRVSYSGELGWELHCPMSGQKALFDALVECGQRHDLVLVGSRALGMMRLEKGYRSWGAELTTEVTPGAAGLEWLCSTGKDYVGRTAVDAMRGQAPGKRYVTLDVDAAAPPCWGTEPLLVGDRPVGFVTSGGMGWRTGRMLAVGWIDSEHARIGNTLQVQILLRCHDATIVQDPVYDPDNLRLRG